MHISARRWAPLYPKSRGPLIATLGCLADLIFYQKDVRFKSDMNPQVGHRALDIYSDSLLAILVGDSSPKKLSRRAKKKADAAPRVSFYFADIRRACKALKALELEVALLDSPLIGRPHLPSGSTILFLLALRKLFYTDLVLLGLGLQ